MTLWRPIGSDSNGRAPGSTSRMLAQVPTALASQNRAARRMNQTSTTSHPVCGT